jgi:GDP-4-dehydro-6-deoxy-D-mannose reductase
MRVFVTGASGFVGSRLVPSLEAAGHETIASDLDVDVRDPDSVAKAFLAARPEAVIHLAAQSSVAASWRDPATAFRVNYLGARNVIRALEAHVPGARLLLVGSGDQYAPTALSAPPRHERDVLEPRSPYAKSKAAAEQLGCFAAQRGLDVVCIRAFNHTGAGQDTQFVASDFAKQVAEIAAGRRAPEMRVGNLESARDFLHVDDVIDAYGRLIDPNVPRGIYNVASGIGTPIRALLDILCELASVTPSIEVAPERFRPTDCVVGDASRLRNATGWRPKTALRETLQELLAYWSEHPDRDGSAARA